MSAVLLLFLSTSEADHRARPQLTLMQFIGYAIATVGMFVYKFSASLALLWQPSFHADLSICLASAELSSPRNFIDKAIGVYTQCFRCSGCCSAFV